MYVDTGERFQVFRIKVTLLTQVQNFPIRCHASLPAIGRLISPRYMVWMILVISRPALTMHTRCAPAETEKKRIPTTTS